VICIPHQIFWVLGAIIAFLSVYRTTKKWKVGEGPDIDSFFDFLVVIISVMSSIIALGSLIIFIYKMFTKYFTIC